MNPDKTKIVTIEKDEYHGTFILTFPLSSKRPVYFMTGMLSLELGKDDTVSYSVKLIEDILEVRIRIDWETEEKEQQKLQEISRYWYDSTRYSNFEFCPINFDLTLTSEHWDKSKTPRIRYIKAGQTTRYLIDELKWKYQLNN